MMECTDYVACREVKRLIVNRNAKQTTVTKPFRILKCRWFDNINMDVKEDMRVWVRLHVFRLRSKGLLM
jgi:hypothetical protein